MNGQVIGNISALADGYDGGDYLLAAPGWNGQVPGAPVQPPRFCG
jgi:hypothetical protein